MLRLRRFCYSVSHLLPAVGGGCFSSPAVAHHMFDGTSYWKAFQLFCTLFPVSFVARESSNFAYKIDEPRDLPGENAKDSLFSASGRKLTKYAFCSALKSCADACNWYLGLQIHGLMFHCGHEGNLILNSVLVDLYCKCDALDCARRVFDGMKRHDQVSWTSMISGYAQNGLGVEAISLFKEMLASHEVKPNSFTYVAVVVGAAACLGLEAKPGKMFHAHAIKLGFDDNVFLVSALIDHYSKWGDIDSAALLFSVTRATTAPVYPEDTDTTDAAVYNSMISGYAKNNYCKEALDLFNRMRGGDGDSLTDYTTSMVLNACGSQMMLCIGKQVHGLVIKTGILGNVFVSCALIDMYSKCGNIEEARFVFDQNVESCVLWTSMISGYAQHGRASEGLDLFDHLLMKGKIVPDKICFTAVLTACNHTGLLERGLEYFEKMRYYGLAPDLDQYACLIDLCARKGHLLMAKELMTQMPFQPNYIMLSSFLNCCKNYGTIELAHEAANQLMMIQPHDCSPYSAMTGVYAQAGLWDKVTEIRKLRKQKGIRQSDGLSWVSRQ